MEKGSFLNQKGVFFLIKKFKNYIQSYSTIRITAIAKFDNNNKILILFGIDFKDRIASPANLFACSQRHNLQKFTVFLYRVTKNFLNIRKGGWNDFVPTAFILFIAWYQNYLTVIFLTDSLSLLIFGATIFNTPCSNLASILSTSTS